MITYVTKRFRVCLDSVLTSQNMMMDNAKDIYSNNVSAYKIVKNKLYLTFKLNSENVEHILRSKHDLNILSIYNLDKDNKDVFKQKMTTKYLYYNIFNGYNDPTQLTIELVYKIKLFTPLSTLENKVK